MPRYRVTGIPRQLASGSALGLSAFMPHFNRLAASGAMAYKGQVVGHPGTVGIPADTQDTSPSPDLGDIVLIGRARSSDAPDMIYPNQYWVTPAANYWPGAGMPVQMYNPTRPQDTTMIPVPATDLRAAYQARSARLSGGVSNDRTRALIQPATFVRWARRKVGNGSSQ